MFVSCIEYSCRPQNMKPEALSVVLVLSVIRIIECARDVFEVSDQILFSLHSQLRLLTANHLALPLLISCFPHLLLSSC